ncbi:MAG TPA: class I SAM-dependent methyltransferase [Caldithrix sp.]|nr:class I SAM-dependent methyltransferase [Calditrichaceae bacterium]HEM49003.1 class I SAM-dependent methyltransferase [Caldithrix sp.]
MDSQFATERNRIKSVFNLASFIYPIIELSLIPYYRKTLERLNLPVNLNVLDFATGTGILAAEFYNRGHSVGGIDFSPRLLKRAKRKYPQIMFDEIDLFDLDLSDVEKADIVSLGYLLHGLSPDLRKVILQKAADLTTEYVIIFDHSNHMNWLTKFIEFLEGSHYKEFIVSDKNKMFGNAGLKIIDEFNVDDFGYCWLCVKK